MIDLFVVDELISEVLTETTPLDELLVCFFEGGEKDLFYEVTKGNDELLLIVHYYLDSINKYEN